ncbi:urease accessory protein UreD [Natranaeroarchaeum aerophilus]|uniref:Urease accessory protein UreD n=1 Tax=Natranaeroarchaeum aerophilus TaxID=2917711 RepID=A0AAE3FQD6_9EURY|nr:urease accessory protein UreD [Natranaeroarchaeum aerophilus]MCL9813354.1 urease accessory protein UreD [Natranaeroarchaeum aerophilus]
MSGLDSAVGRDRSVEDVTLPPAFAEYAREEIEQIPAGTVGKDGVLEASFAGGPSGTRMLRDYSRVPFHHTGPLAHDPCEGMASLCVQTPTGGVAQGDRHRLSVEADDAALASVTGQGATKVHSMHTNFAHLGVDLAASDGSYLEYVPDPTILNRDSRCFQTIDVDVDADSTVIFTDVLVPDGLSEHEPFSFDRFHSRVTAECDGRRLLTDTVVLDPDELDPRTPGVFGELGVVGTLYVLSPGDNAEALSDTVHERLESTRSATEREESNDGPRGEILAGPSTLPEDAGIAVRVLGERSTDVTSTLGDVWDALRRQLVDAPAPDLRKF